EGFPAPCLRADLVVAGYEPDRAGQAVDEVGPAHKDGAGRLMIKLSNAERDPRGVADAHPAAAGASTSGARLRPPEFRIRAARRRLSTAPRPRLRAECKSGAGILPRRPSRRNCPHGDSLRSRIPAAAGRSPRPIRA